MGYFVSKAPAPAASLLRAADAHSSWAYPTAESGRCFSCCCKQTPHSFQSFSNETIPCLFTPSVQPSRSTNLSSDSLISNTFLQLIQKPKGKMSLYMRDNFTSAAPSIAALQQPANTTPRLENQLKCDFCEGPSLIPRAIRECCHLP